MSETKYKRDKKKQLGQFMTPETLASELIGNRKYEITDKILEPSFGKGGFLFPIIEKLLDVYPDTMSKRDKLDKIFAENIYGVEMDQELFEYTISEIERRYSYSLTNHNLLNKDFFLVDYDFTPTYIEGNPPFGGTIETNFGEKLDKIYGTRDGQKIKKETYSFFTVKCVDLLSDNGELGFICSNTFLTINTMKGLRKYLAKHTLEVKKIEIFSDETNYGMVYFNLCKNSKPKINLDNVEISLDDIGMTENFSFKITNHLKKYFIGKTLKNYITCSSGMTIGKNELFLKEIFNGKILEKYSYTIHEEPKTEEKEKIRNKFGVLTKIKKQEIENGNTEKILSISELQIPKLIDLPNDSYKPYNKSNGQLIYDKPNTYIYWENSGEAVLTYKKTGPWYLHGVGGEKFFNKEGFTWSLISDRIKVRYLPEGYILDSGAPVGVLKENVPKDELYFIIGWLLSPITTEILKNVLNHTKNIQSKDIEKLPYPSWVDEQDKKQIVSFVKNLINKKMNSEQVDTNFQEKLQQMFILL